MRAALLMVTLFWAFLARSEDKLPVLIVDGINNHDWQTATRELKALLLETGMFTVDVSTSPAGMLRRRRGTHGIRSSAGIARWSTTSMADTLPPGFGGLGGGSWRSRDTQKGGGRWRRPTR